MGVNKRKKEKRTVNFYRLAFGITEPYRVLLHPDFIRQSVKARINIKEQLPKILQGRAYPVVTRCVIEELKAKGKGGDPLGAAVMARKFQTIQCKHSKSKKFVDDDTPQNTPKSRLLLEESNDDDNNNDDNEGDDNEEEEEKKEEEGEEEDVLQLKSKKENDKEHFVCISASSCIKEILCLYLQSPSYQITIIMNINIIMINIYYNT